VKIPAGIADGQRLRLHGEGEHGARGGPTGDLYVVVHVASHPTFRRDGDDLYVQVDVPFHVMALGGTFKVDTPSGEVEVKVAGGMPNGSIKTFRGKGMPSVTGHGRGSLHVQLSVEVPRELSKDQKKLIEQLGHTMKVEKLQPSAADDGRDRTMFEKVKDLFG
jgi:molecular chaperone DnaJ